MPIDYDYAPEGGAGTESGTAAAGPNGGFPAAQQCQRSMISQLQPALPEPRTGCLQTAQPRPWSLRRDAPPN